MCALMMIMSKYCRNFLLTEYKKKLIVDRCSLIVHRTLWSCIRWKLIFNNPSSEQRPTNDLQRTTNNGQRPANNDSKENMAILKNHLNILRTGLIACFLLCIQMGFGQALQTITDKKDILIGEQIKLTIKLTLPLNSAGLNKWLIIPDSIAHFDIVDPGKTDTINFKDNSRAIEQTINITSFDSGRWVFPALPVEFSESVTQGPADGQAARVIMTDSFFVNVSYSPADTTNQLRDIKPIIKVTVADYTGYYIAGGILLFLLIVYLLYRYFKKKPKLKSAINSSGLSAFDEAMDELKKLSQFNLQDADGIKMYHTKLSAIFKNYLGRKQLKDLLGKTTGDLLISIHEIKLPKENVSDLANALRCADAVKFAKYLPSSAESEDCKQKITATIQLTEYQTLNPGPNGVQPAGLKP